MDVQTRVDEVADRIFRLSTDVDGFSFNQFLVDADEPLLLHTGPRALFPPVSAAMATVVDLGRLRWITYGHYEADECGSVNQWLAAAPGAEVAHGAIGTMVNIADAADRPPRRLADGEVLDLGGRRVRWIPTPHVPHGWDAGLLHEETTGTLFCGDLFTALGHWPALTDGDVVSPALEAEDVFGATCLTPSTAPVIRSLAELDVRALALMHGPTYTGDGPAALRALADAYEERLTAALPPA